MNTRKAHLDWSRGHLFKSDVGLVSADDSASWASTHDRRHPIAVTIDAPHGSIALRADDIAVEDYPGDPEIRSVTLRLHPRDDGALVAELRAGVALYGLDKSAVESWVSSFDHDPQRACTRLGSSFWPGTRTGLEVGYTVQCDWDGSNPNRLVLVDVGPS